MRDWCALSLFLTAALICAAPGFAQLREAAPSLEETESQFLRIVRALEREPSVASVGPWSCPAPEGWTGSRAELYDKAASLAKDLAASLSARQPKSILAEEYGKWAAEERSLAAVARVSCVRSVLAFTRLPRDPEGDSVPAQPPQPKLKARTTGRSVRGAKAGAGSPAIPSRGDSATAMVRLSFPDSALHDGTSNAGGIVVTGSQISGTVADSTTVTASSITAGPGNAARGDIAGVRVFDSSVTGEIDSATTARNVSVLAVGGSAQIGCVQIK